MRNILHHQEGTGDVLAFVSENLRTFRQRAGMSQAALAQAAGLSRRMIVQLEGGDTNISLSSLDRIAAVLKVSFVALVSNSAAQSGRSEVTAWRGVAPESCAILLGSTSARHAVELWSWTLGVGERYDAQPDPDGWQEMLVVTEGELLLDLQEGPVKLATGNFAIYSSAQQYAYINIGRGVTRFIRNVVA
jgi:transcriptional regulator with XRE-family HTH domain